ncbi:MAG: glycoside hydrolase family 3 N-terminal domain-containing protein, partial [Pyrinomonadaceae bacterium]
MIDHISSLSIEQKIGQLFFIGIPAPELDVSMRALLDEISPGGICLFARNIKDASQTRDLLDAIRAVLPVEPFLSIDQEGGLVDRLRRVVTPMPAASKIKTATDAAGLASIIAKTLSLLGFNMNFAPVVDVADSRRGEHSNGLYSRTFGSSKEETAELSQAFLEALQTGGIVGCLKHFPGLGASSVDSHEELPSVNISETELTENDIYPYRALLKG